MFSNIRKGLLSNIPIEVTSQLAYWLNYSRYKSIRNQRISSSTFELKGVFIHIPKTGGTSLKKAFSDDVMSLGHRSAKQVMYIMGPVEFHKYTSFAFVRNPFERLVSAYTFLRQGGNNEQDQQFAKQNLYKYNCFHDFVMEWVNFENINSYHHFKPQYQYIYDKNGRCLINMIGHYETLEQEFNKICKLLSIDRDLPHHNKTQRPQKLEDFYKSNSKQKVAEVYKHDFELFDYEKEF